MAVHEQTAAAHEYSSRQQQLMSTHLGCAVFALQQQHLCLQDERLWVTRLQPQALVTRHLRCLQLTQHLQLVSTHQSSSS